MSRSPPKRPYRSPRVSCGKLRRSLTPISTCAVSSPSTLARIAERCWAAIRPRRHVVQQRGAESEEYNQINGLIPNFRNFLFDINDLLSNHFSHGDDENPIPLSAGWWNCLDVWVIEINVTDIGRGVPLNSLHVFGLGEDGRNDQWPQETQSARLKEQPSPLERPNSRPDAQSLAGFNFVRSDRRTAHAARAAVAPRHQNLRLLLRRNTARCAPGSRSAHRL